MMKKKSQNGLLFKSSEMRIEGAPSSESDASGTNRNKTAFAAGSIAHTSVKTRQCCVPATAKNSAESEITPTLPQQ